MKGRLLRGTGVALLWVLTRGYLGLDYNTGESQNGYPGLALLIAGIGTGPQRHTEIAVEFVGVGYTSIARCIAGFVAVSGVLASTLLGTEIADCGAGMLLNTAVLAHNHSFPVRVGFLHLQIKRQKWKAVPSRVALAGNDQGHLHPAHLVESAHLARSLHALRILGHIREDNVAAHIAFFAVRHLPYH